MKTLAIFLVSLLCISIKCQDFSFYVFASEWTGTICSLNTCNEFGAQNFWNIHGLWPSDGNRSLQYCSDAPFNTSLISSLQSELLQYWNGLYASDDTFHAHEWQKHGTCSGLNEEEYFSTVLQVALHLDIYGTLAENGIVPGDSAYYCEDIARALTNKYGVKSFTIGEQNGYLTEIEMCLDRNLNPQDCPTSSICDNTVKYPILNE